MVTESFACSEALGTWCNKRGYIMQSFTKSTPPVCSITLVTSASPGITRYGFLVWEHET